MEIMFFQIATKENTCPECGGGLMFPYYPNGFGNKGITQCSQCDYNKEAKAVSLKPSVRKNTKTKGNQNE